MKTEIHKEKQYFKSMKERLHIIREKFDKIDGEVVVNG